MRSRGFCFPNPYSVNADEEIHRFFSADRSTIHNAWPELVDSQDFQFAWSNPIIQVWYFPTTKPEFLIDLFAKRELSVEFTLAALHESIHLALNFTPIKDAARLYLSESYHIIYELLKLPHDASKRRFSRLWSQFNVFSQELSNLAEMIMLPEELMATAYSFYALESVIGRREDKIRLARLQDDTIANQNKIVGPDFERLFEVFTKLARLTSWNDRSGRFTFSKLATFLEPANRDYSLLERCNSLVRAIASLDKRRQLANWVEGEIERRDDLQSWGEVVGFLLDYQLRSSTIKHLWSVVNGRKLNRNGIITIPMAERVLRRYGDFRLKSDEYPHTIVFPRELGGIWYVNAEEGGRSVGEYSAMLFTESLRQQLSMRVGFRCPLAGPRSNGSCDCGTGSMKDALLRLTHWAKEGRFGSGEWTDLPYPCGSRS